MSDETERQDEVDFDDDNFDRKVEHMTMMHLLAWRIASRSRRGFRSKLYY